MIRSFQPSLLPVSRAAPFALPAGPLDLEIGAGVGWHAIHYAAANPGRTLIALERTSAKFRAFETRVKAHPELRNLRAIQADAISWVTHSLPPASLDRVFILYPNPEPGRRNQRWPCMPFMERLLQTLKPGGALTLATNIEAYAREAETVMTGHWGLMLETKRELTAGSIEPRTHFEKKYLARGEVCYDLIFRQISPARLAKPTSSSR